MLLAASLDLVNETVIQGFHFEAEASPFTISKGHFHFLIHQLVLAKKSA